MYLADYRDTGRKVRDENTSVEIRTLGRYKFQYSGKSPYSNLGNQTDQIFTFWTLEKVNPNDKRFALFWSVKYNVASCSQITGRHVKFSGCLSDNVAQTV